MILNHEIAKILFEIGDYLELQEIPFKPKAYHQAAIMLDGFSEDVGQIYKEKGLKGLEELPSIGISIAEKIEEFLKTGTIVYYSELKKQSPIDFENLTKVEGLGVKRIKKLYNELGIRDIKTLEEKLDRVASLPGFGQKTADNIKGALEFLKQSKGRFLLREIIPLVDKIEKRLKNTKGVVNVLVSGSTRRRKETIGDVDFLVGINDDADRYIIETVMNTFVSLDEVIKVVSKGETRSSVKTSEGLDMDLRVVRMSSFGSASQYFTGSKEHNIALRRIAIKKGFKLNEYGLFMNDTKVRGETEEGIYERLGLSWVEPELREDQGEIVAAQEGTLPTLITEKDIKGDFHCHSGWDGGDLSLEDMASLAMEMRYEYLGISDHTKSLRIENGLDESALLRQIKEIDRINHEFKEKEIPFRLLKGSEVDILKDGSLDISDYVLSKLDYVSISIHSHFKMSKYQMTERVLSAMNNPYVRILNHPTGKILGKRDSFEIDLDEIFKKAKERGIAIEINSYRADINSQYVRKLKEMGIKMTIGSDAHARNEFADIRFGLYQARRGWASKENILNTMSLDALKDYWK
ncbi:MAG: DNA polymerase/3'-5' exonuclease PolX [Minisyncoccus archaeiphilus]|jgi:DNA polymerase (family 10)|uniref:DNA polymerase/3'-5' exonuclease PolX n=1 Tax=Minisyncoccus archaeiphilus TaxID=3238481 RepID=UPI0009C87042|nr:MAG: DNA polymerase/3'-5' exonuclease PolX [Parcubacteria group bacterium ADurb.Bin216]GMX59028.1 MAG: DNA polymerase/3'-5' exonuclease PolX [Candidatus Parcubacteria bacterium]